MFESALIEHKLAKEEYERAEPELRTKLLEAQLDLVEKRSFATVILVTGMDGAGKSEVIHKLLEWLDPRHVRVAAYGEQDDTERTRPRMWRYWRDLPPRGEISVVFGSWYSDPLRDRLAGDGGKARFERELAAINRFEEMLASEGVLLLKFLLVVSAKEQKRRLDALAKRTGGASRALEEWADVKQQRQAAPLVEEMVRRTSTGHAPWIVLPCDDPEYRDLAFGRAGPGQPAGAAAGGTAAKPAGGAGSHPQRRSPQPARHPRPEPEPGQVRLPQAARGGAGEAARAVAAQGVPRAGAGGGVRGPRRRRQGRRDPPGHHGARSAPVPGLPGGGPDRRGEGPALSVAVLAPRPAAGPHRDLRPLLVRPGPGGAGRGLREPGRVAPRLWRDQRFRGGAGPGRHRRRQVLAGDRQGRAAALGSRRAPTRSTSSSRSRPRTGATARSGTSTTTPSAR